MAQAQRENRPLAPFMLGPYYRPQITSVLSVTHRITGVGLALGAVLLVWWFLAAASGPEAFARADWVLTSWLGGLVLILSAAALWYHFFNGIRHLVWDTGAGMEIGMVYKSGYTTLAATAVMTLFTIIFAWVFA
jgi:succinate dehydrogenase / fumarate reductase, cytochrome b subunit